MSAFTAAEARPAIYVTAAEARPAEARRYTAEARPLFCQTSDLHDLFAKILFSPRLASARILSNKYTHIAKLSVHRCTHNLSPNAPQHVDARWFHKLARRTARRLSQFACSARVRFHLLCHDSLVRLAGQLSLLSFRRGL